MEPIFSTDFETSWGDYRQKLLDLHTGEWRSIRPIVNRDACRKCGWCALKCPAGCIHLAQDGYYRADLYYCKGCGVCVHECPANALLMITEEEGRKND